MVSMNSIVCFDDIDDLETVRFGCTINQLRELERSGELLRERLIEQFGAKRIETMNYLSLTATQKRRILAEMLGEF